MYYTIYKITHKNSGKEYIGMHQTENLNDDYMGSGKYLKRAIEKYGLNEFEKEILHVFDNAEEMKKKEKELVTEEYVSRTDTYNICEGGTGGFGYLNKKYWTKEKVLKRNRTNIKKANTKEARKKALETVRRNGSKIGFAAFSKEKHLKSILNGVPKRTGIKRSEETKKKMSESASGKNNSQYGTMWITDGTNSKKIKKDLTIPEGWYKGRILK
jgi:hypothetical protein